MAKIISNVGNVLFYVVLQLGCVGTAGCVNYSALKGDDYFRFTGRVKIWQVEGFDFLLIDEDDVDSFFEFVDDVGLQVFVEGEECVAWSAPGWVYIDDDQFWIFLIVVVKEVVMVSDGGGEFCFFGRHG